MQLHDSISSYKCFEAIATPSPIPIDFNRNLSSALRSTSLDSLANSSEQDSLSDDQSIGGDIGPLSDTDTHHSPPPPPHHQYQQHPHRKSDLDAFKLSEISANESREPIIKDFLEKSHRKCDYKNCGYKNSDQQPLPEHTIDECATSASSPFSLVQQQQQKIRRTSITSSGSVGRMETIIEEPIEPKISVKEILARFETLTSLEVIHTHTHRYSILIFNESQPFREPGTDSAISFDLTSFYFGPFAAFSEWAMSAATAACIHAFPFVQLIPFLDRNYRAHQPRNPFVSSFHFVFQPPLTHFTNNCLLFSPIFSALNNCRCNRKHRRYRLAHGPLHKRWTYPSNVWKPKCTPAAAASRRQRIQIISKNRIAITTMKSFPSASSTTGPINRSIRPSTRARIKMDSSTATATTIIRTCPSRMRSGPILSSLNRIQVRSEQCRPWSRKTRSTHHRWPPARPTWNIRCYNSPCSTSETSEYPSFFCSLLRLGWELGNPHSDGRPRYNYCVF